MIRGAPGLYPVKEIVQPNTGAAFLVMAGLYGLAEHELEDGRRWFVERVDGELRPYGYRLAGTFEPGSEVAAGVVGFRPIRSNSWGNHLWVEDFVTGGVGAEAETVQLLFYLKEEARRLGLVYIHLDVLPDEPPAEGPDEVTTRGFAAAVQDFGELPIPKDGPLMDSKRAFVHGFREVAHRYVLKVDTDEAAAGQQDQGPSPLGRRRHLGRLRPPRRGH